MNRAGLLAAAIAMAGCTEGNEKPGTPIGVEIAFNPFDGSDRQAIDRAIAEINAEMQSAGVDLALRPVAVTAGYENQVKFAGGDQKPITESIDGVDAELVAQILTGKLYDFDKLSKEDIKAIESAARPYGTSLPEASGDRTVDCSQEPTKTELTLKMNAKQVGLKGIFNIEGCQATLTTPLRWTGPLTIQATGAELQGAGIELQEGGEIQGGYYTGEVIVEAEVPESSEIRGVTQTEITDATLAGGATLRDSVAIQGAKLEGSLMIYGATAIENSVVLDAGIYIAKQGSLEGNSVQLTNVSIHNDGTAILKNIDMESVETVQGTDVQNIQTAEIENSTVQVDSLEDASVEGSTLTGAEMSNVSLVSSQIRGDDMAIQNAVLTDTTIDVDGSLRMENTDWDTTSLQFSESQGYPSLISGDYTALNLENVWIRNGSAFVMTPNNADVQISIDHSSIQGIGQLLSAQGNADININNTQIVGPAPFNSGWEDQMRVSVEFSTLVLSSSRLSDQGAGSITLDGAVIVRQHNPVTDELAAGDVTVIENHTSRIEAENIGAWLTIDPTTVPGFDLYRPTQALLDAQTSCSEPTDLLGQARNGLCTPGAIQE